MKEKTIGESNNQDDTVYRDSELGIFTITNKQEKIFEKEYNALSPSKKFVWNFKLFGKSALYVPLVIAPYVALIGTAVGVGGLNYRFNDGRLFGETYKSKEQTYEIQKPKETYGIEVFYDRGKELITEINSLENKTKYAELQDSIKYSKQIDSLKEQHFHIKNGIEYILINGFDNPKSFIP